MVYSLILFFFLLFYLFPLHSSDAQTKGQSLAQDIRPRIALLLDEDKLSGALSPKKLKELGYDRLYVQSRQSKGRWNPAQMQVLRSAQKEGLEVVLAVDAGVHPKGKMASQNFSADFFRKQIQLYPSIEGDKLFWGNSWSWQGKPFALAQTLFEDVQKQGGSLSMIGLSSLAQSHELMALESHGVLANASQWRTQRKRGGFGFYDGILWASVLHAAGRGQNVPVASIGLGGDSLSADALINLHLFRAVADRPLVFGFAPQTPKEHLFFSVKNARQTLHLYQQFFRGPAGRPIANISYFHPIDETMASPALFSASRILPPVVLGLMAAGYDVRLTLNGKLLANAQIYYLISPGGRVSPPEPWLRLLEEKKRLGEILDPQKKVFFQTWEGMGLTEPWLRVRKVLGVSTDRVIGKRGNLPKTTRYKGQRFRYAGWGPNSIQAVDLEKKELLEARSLLSLPEEGRPVLVAQRGNIFFVNGNYLDLEFTFFLSEIVGRFGRLARPSPAMITLGSTSAVFALEKFELELALPGKGDKVKIFRRHPQKGYHFEDVIAYEGRLELSLLPFEVVIAKRF